MTVPLRFDLGSMASPVMQGDPVRLDVTAGPDVFPASLSYSCWPYIGGAVAATPSFVLRLGDGITVSSPSGGCFEVHLSADHTALWTGKDWHVAQTVVDGQRVPLLVGVVTSTRSLIHG